MHHPLLVGVDVHRRQNVVCLMNQRGQEPVARLRVANNRPGTERLVQQIEQVMATGEFDGLQVSAEATGWYWFHFFQMLNQHPTLAPWPLELYATNPRLTTQYKQSLGEVDKTDLIDAAVTADWLPGAPWARRSLPTPFVPDAQHLPLRFLTRYRRHLVNNLAREKAYYLSMLYLKASEFTHPDKQPFGDVFGVTSQAVLDEFASLEDIAAMPFDDLVEFIDHKGKRRFADPRENAHKLRQVAQDSYPLSDELRTPINLILGLCLQQITQLERQEKRLNTAIAEQMAAMPHTLDTIPGFGPVYAAGIIAELGDIARFDYDQAKVAKYAGLQWRRRQSAGFEAEHTPLAGTGNHYLRYYLCEAANAVRMHDVEYAAFYRKKFNEVRHHRHKRAIVLTARKLVRLVVRLLTTHQPYRPRRMPTA